MDGGIWVTISEDKGKQFNQAEFQEKCQTCGFHLPLAALDHQEMNGQVKVTYQTLHTRAHSLMLHAGVSEAYIHFTLIYTADHICTVLPIKDMINEDGNPTTTF